MSLDTVVEDIRDEARTEAEAIVAEAEAEAAEIIAEAEDDAEAIKADRAAEVERTIEQEREQQLSSAKLEAKQERLEARRDVLASVREQVEFEIASLSGESRAALTRALLDAATDEFDADDHLEISGRPQDADLLEEIASERDRVSYAGEVDCLGGVIVESPGSRIRVNNTFDSVLEGVWEDHLRDISDRLFEDQ